MSASNPLVQRLREAAQDWPDYPHQDLEIEAADEIGRQAQEIERLQNDMARAYMRLQCADVPRNPWHWEVCKILGVETKP